MKIAAAYIPVVHRGHLQFCQKVKPDVLYVLGESFHEDFPFLERDIRALSPEDIVPTCKALNLAGKIRILEKQNLSELQKADTIVFANDEVMRSVAETYFSSTAIEFESVFLRWDKMSAVTAVPVSADLTVSREDFDRHIIQETRTQAKRSSDWWRQVGAVIVKNGNIILKGHAQHKPTEQAPYIDGDPRANFNAGEHIEVSTSLHAEAGLIAQAAQEGLSLKNASLYVSTFPCPGCAMLIMKTGIERVYYADGYSNLNAEQNLKSAGIKLVRVLES